MDVSESRRVGRQRIPIEFRQREDQLRKAASSKLNTLDKSPVRVGPGKVDSSLIGELRSSLSKQHEEPSFSNYADVNSLPYSTSLKALALKSLTALSQRKSGVDISSQPAT